VAPVARTLHVLDFGTDTKFVGWFGTMEGDPTCAMPSVVLTDAAARIRTAKAMRTMGAGCAACALRCPVSETGLAATS
jgi:hypothetical protein